MDSLREHTKERNEPMENQVNLSIIIPYRNNAEMLEKLLESIGTHEEIQTIVIDDSSDKNLEKYKEIKDRFTVNDNLFLVNESNKRSAGICRNIGLKQAKGTWLLFADSDDYFVDDFYDIIKSYFDKKEEVIFFHPTSIDLDTGDVADRHQYFNNVLDQYKKQPSSYHESLLRYKLYVPWSKLIKRDFVEKHGLTFDETFVKNDSLFSVSVGHNMGDFLVADETIYCSTWHSQGNISKLKTEAYALESTISRIHLFDYMKESLSDEELKHVEYKMLPYYHVESLKASNVPPEALKAAIKMFKKYGYNSSKANYLIQRIKAKIFKS